MAGCTDSSSSLLKFSRTGCYSRTTLTTGTRAPCALATRDQTLPGNRMDCSRLRPKSVPFFERASLQVPQLIGFSMNYSITHLVWAHSVRQERAGQSYSAMRWHQSVLVGSRVTANADNHSVAGRPRWSSPDSLLPEFVIGYFSGGRIPTCLRSSAP